MGNSTSSNKDAFENTALIESLIFRGYITTCPMMLEHDGTTEKFFLYPVDQIKSTIVYCGATFYYKIKDPIAFGINEIERIKNPNGGYRLYFTAVILENIPLASIEIIKQQIYPEKKYQTGRNNETIWYKVSPHEVNSSNRIEVSNEQLLTKDLTIHFYDYNFFNTIKFPNKDFDYNEPAIPKSYIVTPDDFVENNNDY